MKIQIDGSTLSVQKEAGDKRMKKPGWGGTVDGASMLLYNLMKLLNAAGCDLIKKRMSKDGHLVNDEQQYLRTRNEKSKGPHVYISDGSYALRCAGEDFNKGKVVNLMITMDVFEKQPDCNKLLSGLSMARMSTNERGLRRKRTFLLSIPLEDGSYPV